MLHQLIGGLSLYRVSTKVQDFATIHSMKVDDLPSGKLRVHPENRHVLMVSLIFQPRCQGRPCFFLEGTLKHPVEAHGTCAARSRNLRTASILSLGALGASQAENPEDFMRFLHRKSPSKMVKHAGSKIKL